MLGLTNELLPLAYEYVWGVIIIAIYCWYYLLLSTADNIYCYLLLIAFIAIYCWSHSLLSTGDITYCYLLLIAIIAIYYR